MKSPFLIGIVAVLAPGLASAALTRRWTLNETSLANGILESVSGSTSATLFGTTTGVVGNPGVFQGDYSFLFNGTNNGVSTGLQNVLPTVSDFSVFVTAVFTSNYQGGARMLFSNNNSQGAGRLDFAINGTSTVPNQLTFFLGAATGGTSLSISFTDSTSDPILFDGGWHEVGISRSGNTFQLYVDGTAAGSPGTSSLAPSTNTNYLIGRRPAFSGFFNDRISEVQVFNEARTEGLAVIPEPTSVILAGIASGMALCHRRRPRGFQPQSIRGILP